jgi:hypothetical protein
MGRLMEVEVHLGIGIKPTTGFPLGACWEGWEGWDVWQGFEDSNP